jgi:NAD(P)-dependent dehydrogenase (short-subunit alcohol dehydrogenase family)
MAVNRKIILIIGGTSGIGLKTAERFAGPGNVLIVTGRSPDKMEEALRQIAATGAGGELVSEVGDASDAASMRKLYRMIEEKFGRLDVLVHVAGISGRKWGDGPLDECTEEGWDVVMSNNAKSVYLSNHHALKMMKRHKQGAIVNVSSILGLVAAQDHFVTHAYAASRAAVIQLSKAAAVFYAKDGIRVNVVCPGLLDTPMSQRAVGNAQIREALTYFQPLAPHIGGPGDVAEAIHFLASEQAGFITGAVLPIDGGWTAQ